LAVPDSVIRTLLGSDSSGDIAIARIAGFGPFLLGLACWPGEDDVVTAQVLWAQLTYNLLIALYLGYLRVGGGFVSSALWPACALHASLALLLAGTAYERSGGKGRSSRSGTA
jgi:hypothetical protein